MKKIYLVLFLTTLCFTSFSQYPPNTVWVPQLPDPILTPPEYLETVLDEVDNVLITRISDPEIFGYPAGSSQLRPPYAKIQAWNADMSKIMLGFTMLLNADDYTINTDMTSWYPQGYFNEGRWSNVDPDIRYFCYGDMFLKVNIATQDIDTLITIPAYGTMTVGPWEGNISADDRYAVITDAAANNASLYDIENDTILSTFFLGGAGFNWASITPSGDYIAVSNEVTDHIELYDLDFNYVRTISLTQSHGDFAVDTDGNEVFVQVIPLSMTRLSDGVTTDLISSALVCGNFSFDPSISGHVSGRNFAMPGWAFVSTALSDECTNGLGYYSATEIFAIKLDGSGILKHYGHAYTTSSVATPNRDGTKLMFTSDWDMENYVPNQVMGYVAEYNNEIELALKVYLEGPFDEVTQLMTDNLRAEMSFSMAEPFTSLGFNHITGGGEEIAQSVLDVIGNNAIVDWIFIEIRDGSSPSTILATRAALLQRDGDVVDLDGVSPVMIPDVNGAEVKVILRHHNHFGIQTVDSYPTNQVLTINFTDTLTNVFGLNSMKTVGDVRVMISGDANRDGQINAVDKNNYWRVENGEPFDYFNTKADFNLDGITNPVDKNSIWRPNNSMVEQLTEAAVGIVENRGDAGSVLSIPLSGSLQNPAFSPDGESIIFTRFINGYNQEPAQVYQYNLSTSELTLVVSDGSGNVNLPGTAWVNDKIVFSSTRDPHDEIYMITEDGALGSEIQITSRVGDVAYEPTISPDGEWVVFESHVLDVEGFGIITKYKVDGTSAYIALTDPLDDCRQPNWSPNNNKILYQKQENNQWNIWIMDIDGSSQMQLTTNHGNCTDASFSADGQFVVFSSDYQVDIANIFKISIDGTNPIQLTTFDGYDGATSISPDGTQLIFESTNGYPDESPGTIIVLKEL